VGGASFISEQDQSITEGVKLVAPPSIKLLKQAEEQERFRSSFNNMKAEARAKERAVAERSKAIFVKLLDKGFQNKFDSIMGKGQQMVKAAINMSSLRDCDDDMEGFVRMALVQETIGIF